jgi:hypothetical protein
MLKRTITYTDYDDNERKEDFHFNLSKSELTELEVSCEGGLTKLIEKVVAENNMQKLIEVFKDLILKAYGEKSPDGRVFLKNKEIRERFSCTEAYSTLFMELATNADSAAAFVNGITPKVS